MYQFCGIHEFAHPVDRCERCERHAETEAKLEAPETLKLATREMLRAHASRMNEANGRNPGRFF
jgi:hypothetical protein